MDCNRIFEIGSEEEFNLLALEVFQYQYQNTPVYREFCDLLKRGPAEVNKIEEIPFLPIELFKFKKILPKNLETEFFFSSSGTTDSQVSRHYIADLELYRKSYSTTFERFYGKADNYCILALLPSYLERKDSSLVFMVDDLISKSNYSLSGFYLNEYLELANLLQKLNSEDTPVILIGVSFALLDMACEYPLSLPNTTVIETGGMKGRRKEIIRAELHQQLIDAWGIKSVHSEYGMTELLSQAYAQNAGIFHCPPWMRVLIRDTEDPLKYLDANKTGGINIIDLANIYSCSFIATQDLGKQQKEGGFEVLGRFDHSDVRGCNLMVM